MCSAAWSLSGPLSSDSLAVSVYSNGGKCIVPSSTMKCGMGVLHGQSGSACTMWKCTVS